MFAFASLAFYSCFSPWKGDEATLTLLFGDSPGSREMAPDGVVHDIELDGPSGRQTHPGEGAKSFSVTVVPGYWKISVKAFLDGSFYAEGKKDADIKAGRNNRVEITMGLVVAFDPNGADEGEVPAYITVKAGEEKLLPRNPGKLVKNGSTFAGWGASPNSTPNDVILIIRGDKTLPQALFAIWQVNLYTVTFDDNEATGGTIDPESITQNYAGEEIILPKSPNIYKIKNKDDPNSDYFTFGGWSTNKTPYGAVSSPYTPESDKTLYAIWEE